MNFDSLWDRVVAHAGKIFTQIHGGTFTYEVTNNQLVLDRTNQTIPRRQLEEAFLLEPLTNTTSIQHLRAPSYLFAILTDERIRGEDVQAVVQERVSKTDSAKGHNKQEQNEKGAIEYTKSEQLSRKIWPVLIDLASIRQTTTYKGLGAKYKIHGQALQNFARILAPIKYYCIEHNLPPLSALVIYTNSTVPGSGAEADELDIDRVFAYNWKGRSPLVPSEAEFAEVMKRHKDTK